MMTSTQIRQSFLDFFKSKQHTIVPSSSLMPDSPNLLFTNAGMNQFVPIFLGQVKCPYTPGRAADTQKCIRAGGKHNDLDDVGLDTYHHTFFEMLGNWSFGDYFKKDAINWAWELIIEVWKFPPQRLYATIYQPDKTKNDPADRDQEAWELWAAKFRSVGLDPDIHIVNGNKKDNFWMMGETGPCGPCTEMHVDLRPGPRETSVDEQKSGAKLVNGSDARCIEIWNNVFIQYNANPDGTFTPLPAQHVDTGMGFERVTSIIQGTKGLTDFQNAKISNYETDIFRPIFDELEKMSGKRYGSTLPGSGNPSAAGIQSSPSSGNPAATGHQPSPGSGNPTAADRHAVPSSGNPTATDRHAPPSSGNPTAAGRHAPPSSENPTAADRRPPPGAANQAVSTPEASENTQIALDIAFRVIADHIRTLSFAIADGIQPGNNDRNYVLRRILRRAVRYGRTLGFREPFFYKLVDVLAATMGDVFPEIRAKQQHVKDVLKTEEESFNKTLDTGIKLFEGVANSSDALRQAIQGADLGQAFTKAFSDGVSQRLLDALQPISLTLANRLPTFVTEMQRVQDNWAHLIRSSLLERFNEQQQQWAKLIDLAQPKLVNFGEQLGAFAKAFAESSFAKQLDAASETANRTFNDRQQELLDHLSLQAFAAFHEHGLLEKPERAEKFYKLVGAAIASALEAPAREISGAEAFKLYDTYGFPLDLTELMARERGLTVDTAGFEKLMEEQRARARAAQKKEVISLSQIETTTPTKFTGYENLATKAKVLEVVGLKDKTAVILDTSTAYAEMGGQVGDTGELSGGGQLWRVVNTQKSGNTWLHFLAPERRASLGTNAGDADSGRAMLGAPEELPLVGSEVEFTVDRARRAAIQRHHTVTHLLHWALHEVVSKDATQKGSFVGPDKLTFDFNHAALTPAQLADIEKLVNERILDNATVSWTEVPHADVKNRADVMQFFGDKYGDVVRVVQIGGGANKLDGYSMELCGGTHTRATGEIGLFRIVGENAIAAGVRRIEAVAGLEAYALANSQLALIRSVAGKINSPVGELEKKIEALLAQQKELEKSLRTAVQRNASNAASELLIHAQTVNGIPLIAHNLGDAEADFLQAIVDALKGRFQGVVVLGGGVNDKVTLLASVSAEFTAKVQAGKIIQTIAPIVGGKGGGKPDLARGGGKDAAKVEEALAKAKTLLG